MASHSSSYDPNVVQAPGVRVGVVSKKRQHDDDTDALTSKEAKLDNQQKGEKFLIREALLNTLGEHLVLKNWPPGIKELVIDYLCFNMIIGLDSSSGTITRPIYLVLQIRPNDGLALGDVIDVCRVGGQDDPRHPELLDFHQSNEFIKSKQASFEILDNGIGWSLVGKLDDDNGRYMGRQMSVLKHFRGGYAPNGRKDQTDGYSIPGIHWFSPADMGDFPVGLYCCNYNQNQWCRDVPLHWNPLRKIMPQNGLTRALNHFRQQRKMDAEFRMSRLTHLKAIINKPMSFRPFIGYLVEDLKHYPPSQHWINSMIHKEPGVCIYLKPRGSGFIIQFNNRDDMSQELELHEAMVFEVDALRVRETLGSLNSDLAEEVEFHDVYHGYSRPLGTDIQVRSLSRFSKLLTYVEKIRPKDKYPKLHQFLNVLADFAPSGSYIATGIIGMGYPNESDASTYLELIVKREASFPSKGSFCIQDYNDENWRGEPGLQYRTLIAQLFLNFPDGMMQTWIMDSL